MQVSVCAHTHKHTYIPKKNPKHSSMHGMYLLLNYQIPEVLEACILVCTYLHERSQYALPSIMTIRIGEQT